ncbi:MAG: bifunctional nuclease domain-containing protein [Calditrichia bacterium]
MIEVKINGLFLTQSQASGVILKEMHGDRTLPIIIGEYEAQSIALGLENIKPPRPITHDLTLSIIETFGGQIERIIVTELKNNTYYAIVQIRRKMKVYEIDSRPSDAIALAVRNDIPIYVAEEVMERGAYSSDDLNEIEKGKVDVGESRLDQLKKQLDEAVEKEDYERAARLRDEINKLTSRQ